MSDGHSSQSRSNETLVSLVWLALLLMGAFACDDRTPVDPAPDSSMDVATGEGDSDSLDAGGDTGDVGGDVTADGNTGDDTGIDTGDARDAPTPEFVGSWGGRGRKLGEFVEPSSVSLDGKGFVYVAGHEDRFQKFTRAGKLVAIYGSPGDGDGEFDHPHGITVDQKRGLVYVGDQENHRLQVFKTDGTFVRKFGSGKIEHIHDIGLARNSGDVYVGDLEHDTVSKYSPKGTLKATYGGSGTKPGKFDGVWGIATDSVGDIYVADSSNDRIQKLGSDGTFLAQWSDLRGTPFAKPTGVFVDANDTVYVCDSHRQEVLLFDQKGSPLERWDLKAITGLDTEPEDIVVDAAGTHIYVADVRGHRVLHLVRR